jgi:hypothetical protein
VTTIADERDEAGRCNCTGLLVCAPLPYCSVVFQPSTVPRLKRSPPRRTMMNASRWLVLSCSESYMFDSVQVGAVQFDLRCVFVLRPRLLQALRCFAAELIKWFPGFLFERVLSCACGFLLRPFFVQARATFQVCPVLPCPVQCRTRSCRAHKRFKSINILNVTTS